MSAFLVSHAHISALVFARQLTRYSKPFEHMSDDQLGRMLLRENMLSLGARYNDPIDEAEITAFVPRRTPPLSVVALIKAVHCYEYQACEHDAWEASDARKYCEALLNLLEHALPGYDEAPWGIDDAPASNPSPVRLVPNPNPAPARKSRRLS